MASMKSVAHGKNKLVILTLSNENAIFAFYNPFMNKPVTETIFF